MRRADVLQASLMLRYVNKMRFVGLTKMVRAYCPGTYPVSSLTSLFMFEDEAQTIVYLNHCGFNIFKDAEYGNVIRFTDQRLRDLMPRDKNDDTIEAPRLHMKNTIESKLMNFLLFLFPFYVWSHACNL
jgi:hypothetical protein